MRTTPTITIILVAAFCISGCATVESISQEWNVPVAIRAPVDCYDTSSCGEDISLEKAKESYTEHGEAKIFKRRDTVSTIAATLPFEPTPILESHICDRASTTAFYYFWAPIQQFKNGDNALQSLLLRARLGNVRNGYVVVEASKSTPEQKHIALCKAVVIGGISGPPRECVTVAILTSQETWVRGGDANQLTCAAQAFFRNSGVIDIEYTVTGRANPVHIAELIQRALEADFGLAVDRDISTDEKGKFLSAYIRATSSLRNSTILETGWREALDFDVYIYSLAENKFSVRGNVRALVCRQALGNIVDYQGPSAAQQGAYATAFDSGVEAAIRKSSKICKKIDAKTLICD